MTSLVLLETKEEKAVASIEVLEKYARHETNSSSAELYLCGINCQKEQKKLGTFIFKAVITLAFTNAWFDEVWQISHENT